MGTASIGGKDSMSGSFQELKVTPNLFSFAVTTENSDNIKGGAFIKANSTVYYIPCEYNNDLTPNFDNFKAQSELVYKANKAGLINAMYPVGAGGIAEAISKMAFGNNIGINIDDHFCKSLKIDETVQQMVLRGNGQDRSEERRVGKECTEPCITRGSPGYREQKIRRDT